MKRSKKIFIISLTIIFIVFIFLTSLCFGIFFSISKNVSFNKDKLLNTDLHIEIFDNKNNLISDKNMFNNQYVKLNALDNNTINAFISIEDKNFYSHNGINIKRILGALYKNFLNGKAIQGASTISQQLIKNTHLSSEKTYTRKIKEISLAIEMEKQLSKDEILENYLNLIYFGNNIYGIENASNFYFSKSSSQLSLEESALLAGLIKSPAYYCPIINKENAKKRRNLVLLEMKNDNKISEQDYQKAINTEILLNIDENFDRGQNSYSQYAIDEASNILKMPAKQIAIGGFKIYTYFDSSKQLSLQNAILNEGLGFDQAGISINNNTYGIEAFYGKSPYNILKSNRQPGSTIKPILVYGPAFNENIITPATKILDDEININGYKPKNFNKKFSGYVSVRDAVSKSINIPAVKVLSYLNIPKAKRYCQRLGITFDEKDNGYALALGGMTYGTNLKSLVGAYTIFSNNGKYVKPSFITKIEDKNGKIIYQRKYVPDQVLREDSNYLTLSTMLTSVEQGTSKKLASLPYMVAGKTGTVGNDLSNSDAYSIALTSSDTVGIWVGDYANNNIGNLTGGNQPTSIIKTYFSSIYKNQTPKDFQIPTSITEVEIDALEYEKNNIVLQANDYIPSRYKIKDYFSRFNLPKEKSTNFLEITPAYLNGRIENENYVFQFNAESYLSYELYRVEENGDVLVKTFSGENGKVTFYLPKNDINTKFYLITKIKNHSTNQEISSEKSNIIEFIGLKTNNEENKKSWYI